jgi:hypothetical protein
MTEFFGSFIFPSYSLIEMGFNVTIGDQQVGLDIKEIYLILRKLIFTSKHQTLMY